MLVEIDSKNTIISMDNRHFYFFIRFMFKDFKYDNRGAIIIYR